MTSVSQWLASVGLGQYAEAFDNNAVGWDVLAQLDHSILRDIGVRPVGDRVRILNAIKCLGSEKDSAQADLLVSPLRGGGGAERRQLTVMFCDIVDFCRLTQEQDLEDLRDLISDYQLLCRSAIEHYEGFIARFVGDGVLAYFGYPHAHEEDAERAVRAGLRIIERLTGLNARTAERHGTEISVRIGLATGPVVVGDVIGDGTSRERVAIGGTPNVAARLQAIAQPNTIVITTETRRIAHEYFEYQDLGEQQLKGLAAPIRAWRVVRERAIEFRFEARQNSDVTPLVGREEELALILRRWELAKESEGQVVLLSGDPGIGKSRLAQMLRASISKQAHALVCYQCSPYHANSALYPIIKHLRSTMKIDEVCDARSQREKLEATLRLSFDDITDVAPVFTALLSINAEDCYRVAHHGPEGLKEATIRALVSQFSALSAKQPVLLIVEDAHWIDPTTQEVLDLLLSEIANKQILAIITHRPDYCPPVPGFANALVLRLIRLPRRDIVRMAEKVAAGKSLPPEVLDQIIAKTDGVPLFIEELTKTVIESGLLIETNDSYRLSTSVPEITIPATLQDSLMARLHRMASIREVAQVCACIGRHFSLKLLANVLDQNETALSGALRQLEIAGLLCRSGTASNVNYTFKHALIQDAAHSSLLRNKRKRLHARIAEALLVSGDAAESAPEILANHHLEAEQFDRAAFCWRQAAELAGKRYANSEAIAHCRNGLQALSRAAEGPDRIKVETALRIRLATSLCIFDRYEEAIAELESAEALALTAVARDAELKVELSKIYHLRGNIAYPLGRIDDCLKAHQAAWHYAKKGRAKNEAARALGGLGDAYFLAGDIRKAHLRFKDCIKFARANGLLETEVANLPMRAVTHMYCLEFDEALRDCHSVIELVTRVGQARGELIARSTSSWILLDQGEFALAEQHARLGLDTVEVIGARRFIPLFNDVLARVQLYAGDRDGALTLLDESLSISEQTGITFAGPVVLGAVALATTDPDRCAAALRWGESILQKGCASHNHFRFYRDAIEVNLRLGLWEAAENYADALEGCFGAHASPWAKFFSARCRALATAGRRGPDESVLLELQQLQNYASAHGVRAAVCSLEGVLASA